VASELTPGAGFEPPPPRSPVRPPFGDVLLFAVTLAFAVHLEWSAHDLVWGLWASSLLTGALFMLAAVVRMFRLPDIGVAFPDATPSPLTRVPWVRIPVLAFFAVFTTAFFAAHYSIFHFVHGIFLNGYLPLTGEAVFGTTPEQTLAWFGGLVATAFTAYWPVAVAAALTRRRRLIQAATPQPGLEEKDQLDLLEPYKNVFRMHVFLILLGVLGGMEVDEMVLYLALFLFFFPLEEVVRMVRRRKEGRPSTSGGPPRRESGEAPTDERERTGSADRSSS
jgi:hypothetical protein